MSVTLVCSSPNHPGRSAQPDWLASLGTATKQINGMLCPACVRLDPPNPALVNRDTVMTAIGQAIVDLATVVTDMQTLAASASPGAGTLTSAQLSTAVRQLDTNLRTVVADLSTTALALKRAARLLNGDFSSSG